MTLPLREHANRALCCISMPLSEVPAAHFLRFQNGRIVKFCGIVDSFDAVRQLGDH